MAEDADRDRASQLLETLTEFSDAVIVCDGDDRVLFTNRAYHSLFPASPDQENIRGWRFEEVIRRTLASGQVMDPLLTGSPEAFIARRVADRAALRGRAASESWIAGRWYRRTEERTPNGCLTTVYTDITDLDEARRAVEAARTEAERERALLAAAIEAMPGGFMLMDDSLNYVIWNSRYPTLGGTTAEVIRGHRSVRDTLTFQAARGDYDDLRLDPAGFPPDQIATLPCLRDLLALQASRPPGVRPGAAEQAAMVEWQLLRFSPTGRPDGQRAEDPGNFTVAGTGAQVEFRRSRIPGHGWVSVYTDVTERNRQQAETQAARAAAEQALADLRATQASLIASEKLASLGGLVAGVAHELNTPVGIAFTAASHLEAELVPLCRSVAENRLRRSELIQFLDLASETVRLMQGNCERAAKLVKSFKNVAADHTHDERRHFSLKPFLEEIIVSLGPRWKRGGHQVRLDCPDGIGMESFPGSLGLVLTNLVINAVVHGFVDGRPGDILLAARLLAGGRLELSVRDNGRGIPPALLARIFDPFFTTRRGEGSTGLGLHLSYNIVARTLGGRLEVESTPGKGTCFFLRLPLVAPWESAPLGEFSVV